MLLSATPTIKPGHRRVSKATSRPVIMGVTDTRVWHFGQVLSEPSGSDLPRRMTGVESTSQKISKHSGQCLDPRNIVPVESAIPKFIDPPFKNPCPFRQNTILVTGTNCNGYRFWINKINSELV